jgi:hypothetical protein
LLLVDTKARGDGLFAIILALKKLPVAPVAETLSRWRIKNQVVKVPTLLARPTAPKPLENYIMGNLKAENAVD